MSSSAICDVGNLAPVLTEYFKANKRPLSYERYGPNNFMQWKQTAVNKLIELAGVSAEDALRTAPEAAYYETVNRKDLDSRVIKTRIEEEYTEETVCFTPAAGAPIEARLLIPTGGKGPFPAVIAMHDHGGFYYFGLDRLLGIENEPPVLTEYREKMYSSRFWPKLLARSGYVVLCIDAFYFGSRRLKLEAVPDHILARYHVDFTRLSPGSDEYIRKYNDFCIWYEHIMLKYIHNCGTTWPGILINDDIRCVDFLVSRPEVDPARIGCCGASVGGFRSAHLAAVDPRIRCAVAAGWMPTAASMITEGLRFHTLMVFIPRLTEYMELYDAVGCAAPTPLFIQQCSQDSLYTLKGMQTACDKLTEIYSGSRARENFQYRFYDTFHQFNTAMQDDGFEWLHRWLKGE